MRLRRAQASSHASVEPLSRAHSNNLRFEIYSTDESGMLNKTLKFLPLHHRSPGLVSIFGPGPMNAELNPLNKIRHKPKCRVRHKHPAVLTSIWPAYLVRDFAVRHHRLSQIRFIQICPAQRSLMQVCSPEICSLERNSAQIC